MLVVGDTEPPMFPKELLPYTTRDVRQRIDKGALLGQLRLAAGPASAHALAAGGDKEEENERFKLASLF